MKLDLTRRGDQQQLLELIAGESNVILLWLAIPCGTFSRAREKPIPKWQRARGVPAPKPLRSGEHPRGFPWLAGKDALRVEASNSLVDFAIELIKVVADKRASWCIENPRGSWLWSVKEVAELSGRPTSATIDYQACMHGGSRDKWQRLLTNLPTLKSLEARCDGGHTHLPWGAQMAGSNFLGFATAEEAEYPQVFCEKVAKALAEQVKSAPPIQARSMQMSAAQAAAKEPKKGNESKAKRARLLPALGLQPKGRVLGPLVPEFRQKIRLEDHSDNKMLPEKKCTLKEKACIQGVHLPPGTKVLDQKTEGKSGVELGIPWTEGEFVSQAMLIDHPFNRRVVANDRVARAIFWILTTGSKGVARHRKGCLERWRRKAAELETKEEEIFKAMHPDVRSVVAGKLAVKRPLLFKEILKEVGFPHVEQITQMLVAGVPMFGKFPATGVFPEKEVEATNNVEKLMRASRWSRRALLGSMRPSGDDELDKAIYKKTQEELEWGMLNGPFTEEQLTAKLGPLWVPARRFGILQGDYRQIDDYSEYGHNATSETSETIDAGGLDWAVGIAKVWAQALEEGKKGRFAIALENGEQLVGHLHPDFAEKSAGRELLGRSLDLEKAFKQLARDPKQAALSVVAVWNPEKKMAELFEATALAFGARNCVYGFNYFARALEWILTLGLGVPCMHYFDDYPHLECQATAEDGRRGMEEALNLLGWRFKASGPKAAPFSTKFVTLGAIIDLTDLSSTGKIIVANKPEREEKIKKQLQDIREEGIIRPGVAASLAGSLQYSDAQVLGKAGGWGLRALREVSRGPPKHIDEWVLSVFRFWDKYFELSKPRVVEVARRSPPILIFTDGCAEGENFEDVGVGATLHDPMGGPIEVLSARVSPGIVDSWRVSGQKQVIGQGELFPVLLARHTWRERLVGRQVIHFIDNDSAKDALIKGHSSHPASMEIIEQVWAQELELQSSSWYDRVPSASNPADGPSRGCCQELLDAGAVQVEPILPPKWWSRGNLLPWP